MTSDFGLFESHNKSMFFHKGREASWQAATECGIPESSSESSSSDESFFFRLFGVAFFGVAFFFFFLPQSSSESDSDSDSDSSVSSSESDPHRLRFFCFFCFRPLKEKLSWNVYGELVRKV